MTTIGTRLFNWWKGELVGTDSFGNRYFREKGGEREKIKSGGRRSNRRRWVMYAGEAEASRVPPEWHAWLHHTTDAPLDAGRRRSWQKPHLPNLTGTPAAYRPRGHDFKGGKRAKGTGDYQAWRPK